MRWTYYKYATKLFILRQLRTLFLCLDSVVDLFTGYSYFFGTRKERTAAVEAGKRGQRVKIVWGIPGGFLEAKQEDFIFKHKCYLKADDLNLENDEKIALFGVTKKTAIFSVTGEGVDVWETKRFPFGAIAQWDHARELIFLPIEEFHRVAQNVGKPKSRLSLMYITGRAGSTLICQILDRIPGVRVLSEPRVYPAIMKMFLHGEITKKEKADMIKSCTRVLLANVSGYDLSVIKLTWTEFGLYSDFCKLFPQSVNVFICRTPKKCIKSLHGVLRWGPGNRTPGSEFLFRDYIPFPAVGINKVIDNHRAFWWNCKEPWKFEGEEAVTVYALSLWHFLRNKKGFSHTIIYDRFVENTREQILQLLESLRLPKEHLELGYSAMNKYSQAGVGLPSGKLAKDDGLDKLRKAAKKIFKIYGVKIDFDVEIDAFEKYLQQ